MDPPPTSKSALFQVYLRLRPPPPPVAAIQNQSQIHSQSQSQPQTLYPTLPNSGSGSGSGSGAGAGTDRFLTVEDPHGDADADASAAPTHITLHPPNDNRRRAVEKFAFTRVFGEESSQLEVFRGAEVRELVEGVLGVDGGEGRDGLMATLGVTGSGKSHTILGSKNQRGLTQLALDLLFRSIDENILDVPTNSALHASIVASDASEAQVFSAQTFLDAYSYDPVSSRGSSSRAPTPMVGDYNQPTPRRTLPQRPSALPSLPDISHLTVDADPHTEYVILISMYEVYNDRIFDLLTPAALNKSTRDSRRRPLLFKPTELSPDRKVVAGLRKIVCGNVKDALMVLEAGLLERRVAGTGSNSVSSRSHGFFCVEVKKRRKSRNPGPWGGSALTIVDLAGSERARDSKTQGATLAEAGKINESLMYLGQCLQMQSDLGNTTKPNLVPYRQCKLTELLFSNSFPSVNQQHQHSRNPQKAIMIVTADPLGDFNATSQILRYSALAREITVPRVPSITATILASSQQSHSSSHSHSQSQSHYPLSSPPTSPYYSHRPGSATSTERATMEIAALEIARMSEEIDGLRAALLRETEKRMEWEAHARALEEKMLELEMEVREECVQEMERRLEEVGRRWRGMVEEAGEREVAWRDRKVEVLLRGLGGGEEGEGEDKENENFLREGLEEENRRLRREVESLRREVANERSPVKRKSERALREKRGFIRGVSQSQPQVKSRVENPKNARRRVSDDEDADADEDDARDGFENGNENENDEFGYNHETFDLGESIKRLRIEDEQLVVEKIRGSGKKGLGNGSRVGSGSSSRVRSRVGSRNASACVSVSGSPVKRVRKLTARKWDLDAGLGIDDGEM
ncbi:hypothetical protein ACMFMG_007910 [Clarireedia jacksonii]